MKCTLQMRPRVNLRTSNLLSGLETSRYIGEIRDKLRAEWPFGLVHDKCSLLVTFYITGDDIELDILIKSLIGAMVGVCIVDAKIVHHVMASKVTDAMEDVIEFELVEVMNVFDII